MLDSVAEIIRNHGKWIRQETGGKRANLSGANLSRADLSEANLRRANLIGANLSGAKNLLDPITWLLEHFERDTDNRGLIAYKTFGTNYPVPEAWEIVPGSILVENVNPFTTSDCACGVNVATRTWINCNGEASSRNVWKCLIRWEWLAGVVVPYHTDGKIRCGRVELLEIVS